MALFYSIGSRLIAVLLVTLAVFSSTCLSANEPPPTNNNSIGLDKVRLQLKWYHQFQFAGYYAAVEQGYYEEAGLDVEILENDIERSPVEVLLQGDAEYGVTSAGVLLERAENKPVVALAAIMQHSPLALLVLESSGIKQPADLAGKRVMLGEGETAAEVIAMLRQAGVRAGDYEAQTPSYNPQDLIDGKTDALFAYVSNEGFFLDQQGIDYRYLSPSRFGVDFYSDLLITSETELSVNPKRVERFRQASLKGWEYAMENPDKIVDLIYQQYNTQNKSKQHLTYEANSLREMIQPMFVEMGYMHVDRWHHIADVFRSLGLLGSAAPIEDLMYHKPDTIWGMERALFIWLLAAVVGGLVLLAVLFQSYMWNRNLQLLIAQRTHELDMALKESNRAKEQIESIVNSINDGLAVVDKAGDIVLSNPELRRLTGRTTAELQGLAIDRLIEQGGDQLGAYEVQITHLDGYPFPVDVSRAELDGQDGMEVLIIRDLSEQLSAERSRQRDASELAYRAGIAETNATIFHNIGNSVTGLMHQAKVWQRHEKKYVEVAKALEQVGPQIETEVKKLAQLSEDNLLHRVPEGMRKMAELVDENTKAMSEVSKRIDHGVTHIAEIIRIQQQMSKQDAGKGALASFRNPSFSFNDLIQDTIQLEAVMLERHQVVTELRIDENLPYISCSRNELLQCLINLLRNSIQAVSGRTDMPPGSGKIIISAWLNESAVLEVNLIDNGEGIEPERLPHLFQYGYTSKADGSGFGLSSVANFIREQGGDISIYSDGINKGSSVKFTLPIA